MLQAELIPNQNLLAREELSTPTAITKRGTKNHEGKIGEHLRPPAMVQIAGGNTFDFGRPHSAHQELSVIGDDAIDSPTGQPHHGTLIIDGPGKNSPTRGTNLL